MRVFAVPRSIDKSFEKYPRGFLNMVLRFERVASEDLLVEEKGGQKSCGTLTTGRPLHK
jgi:hypothetical protein